MAESAGIALRLNDCVVADRMIGWSLDSTPELQLGGNDGEQTFHRIRGVASLPNGGVSVLDLGSKQLRFYDQNGKLFAQKGGAGSGPGEFRYPFLVRTDASDSVLIFDTGHRRATWFTVDADGAPTSAQMPGLKHGAPTARVRGKYLIQYDVLNFEKSLIPGLYKQDVTAFLFDPQGERSLILRVDTVGVMFVGKKMTGGVPDAYAVPFASYPSVAATSTNALLTTGVEFEIAEYDTTGSLRRLIRLDRRRRPVTGVDIERYKDGRLHAGASEEEVEAVSTMPVPDSMPAFTALVVDARGNIWAELGESADYADGSFWLVFDSEGRARGTVTLPHELKIREIGDDFVIGTWSDEFDVEYVRKYRLHRR